MLDLLLAQAGGNIDMLDNDGDGNPLNDVWGCLARSSLLAVTLRGRSLEGGPDRQHLSADARLAAGTEFRRRFL